MAVEVIMPQMGESIFEGTVTKWLKKPGDSVARDEPLFEISTDKVDAEIPSPAAGILKEIKVPEGATVPIQTVVGIIETEGAAVSSPSAAAKGAPASALPASAAAREPATGGSAVPTGPTAHETTKDVGARTSPLVRRLAREHQIDLSRVRGTGAGGRISKKDVEDAIAKGAPPAVASHESTSTPEAHPAHEAGIPRERIYFGKYETQPMSPMRQRIAEHMTLSKRISPHVYSVDEADMTRISELRSTQDGEWQKRHGGKLTYMPFFVRACVEALRAMPTVNASVDGANLVLHSEINIGIAVALDWGLIVPVIKNAGQKNFVEIQKAITDLADRARNKKLSPEEVQESTFTITNPGVFGGLLGLPIINQPNVAILAIGAVQPRPVVIDNAIVIRSMTYLTLSYDHRAVDGATGHKFLAQIKHQLEHWDEAVL